MTTRTGDQRLGQRVIAARNRLGVSRAATARAAGIDYVTLWRIETSRSDASLGTLKRLAVALGCDTAELLP
jgi:transcriptional regulator with XRE-family HTH domain